MKDGGTNVYFGHVIAYRPGKPEDAMIDRSPSVEADIILDDVIGENQLHKCAVADNGCKKTADAPCKVSQKYSVLHQNFLHRCD